MKPFFRSYFYDFFFLMFDFKSTVMRIQDSFSMPSEQPAGLSFSVLRVCCVYTISWKFGVLIKTVIYFTKLKEVLMVSVSADTLVFDVFQFSKQMVKH